VPNARADTFTYTYCTLDGILWKTPSIAGVTSTTTLPGADLVASMNTGGNAGCVTTSVVLNDVNMGINTLLLCNGIPAGIEIVNSFPLSGYTAPGTYTITLKGGDITLDVKQTPTPTPQPSSVTLMPVGVGMLFSMRKRKAQGPEQVG
jgi:hypothetical protein